MLRKISEIQISRVGQFWMVPAATSSVPRALLWWCFQYWLSLFLSCFPQDSFILYLLHLFSPSLSLTTLLTSSCFPARETVPTWLYTFPPTSFPRSNFFFSLQGCSNFGVHPLFSFPLLFLISPLIPPHPSNFSSHPSYSSYPSFLFLLPIPLQVFVFLFSPRILWSTLSPLFSHPHPFLLLAA